MIDIAGYVEIRELLEAVAAVEDRLSPNEREMYRNLAARHREPGPVAFDDRTCLEVMLRNVKIRQGFGDSAGPAAGRVIDLTPRRRPRRN